MLSALCGSHRQIAVRTVLGAQFDEQQAQEVIHLGQRGDGALAPAAAGALFDGHRRRNTEDGVDVGARSRLHELARVGVERLQVTTLAFVEQDVEGHRALAGAGHPGDHGQLVARDVDGDILQVVLARVQDLDGGG